MDKKPKLMAVPDALQEKSMQQFYNEITIDVLARTIWGEARGEGSAGMQAIANVVLNRVKIAQEKGKFWWGNNIIQVCQKPYQFSCWNRTDPNFRTLNEVTINDLYFATAVRIAHRAVAEVLPDLTSGATHYHEQSISPYWVKGERPCAVIGRHKFYRIVG